MSWRILAAALLGVFCVTPLASGDDKASLQGTWKLEYVKWAEAGKTVEFILSSKSYLIVEGDQMTERDEDSGAGMDTKYSYTLDHKKRPPVYQRKALGGKNKGKTFSGIYAVDGDTLKMCRKSKGLPDDFEIKQGQDVKSKYLYVYKRVKKK